MKSIQKRKKNFNITIVAILMIVTYDIEQLLIELVFTRTLTYKMKHHSKVKNDIDEVVNRHWLL